VRHTGVRPARRSGRTRGRLASCAVEAPILLSVPNVSEGRSESAIAQIADAFAAPGVRLLDAHSDRDHHRSVFTLAGRPGELADGLLAGASVALEHVDVVARPAQGPDGPGLHPHVGALDVVPIVYLHEHARGAACAVALLVADRIGSELEVPVFLYGELTGSEPGMERTRAELRRGGLAGLARRMAAAEHPGNGVRGVAEPALTVPLEPDFGPARMHPRGGATLVAARPPLVAFNLQLAPPATLEDARTIAARLREGGEQGLPGLRAIGLQLGGGIVQLSMNVERPFELPLAAIVAAVQDLVGVASAELVGLAPAAALRGFPAEVPIPGFDPARHIIENALGC